MSHFLHFGYCAVSPTVKTFDWWRKRTVGFGNAGCWVWDYALANTGYGITDRRSGEYYAHRLSYRVFNGEIERGLHLDHLCRNRACVNPAHLEAVTQKVNNSRGQSPAALYAARTHCEHGHAFKPDNIYRCATRPGIRICRTCAINKAALLRKSYIAQGLCVRCKSIAASTNRTMCAACRQIESKATMARLARRKHIV